MGFVNSVFRGLNHISPTRVFQSVQGGKLAGEAVQAMAPSARAAKWSAIRSHYKANGGFSQGAADWWAGHDLFQKATPLSMASSQASRESVMRTNMIYRRAAVGALAGATLVPAIAGQNIFSDASRTALTGGAVATASATLISQGRLLGAAGRGGKLHQALGWGIAGVSVLNMLRPGDNRGPF